VCVSEGEREEKYLEPNKEEIIIAIAIIIIINKGILKRWTERQKFQTINQKEEIISMEDQQRKHEHRKRKPWKLEIPKEKEREKEMQRHKK